MPHSSRGSVVDLGQPGIADSLRVDNELLRSKLAYMRREHNRLTQRLATFARVVRVLEVETPNWASRADPMPPSAHSNDGPADQHRPVRWCSARPGAVHDGWRRTLLAAPSGHAEMMRETGGVVFTPSIAKNPCRQSR
jgi:hypothetical protein